MPVFVPPCILPSHTGFKNIFNYVCLEKLLVLGIFLIVTILAEVKFSSSYWAFDKLLFWYVANLFGKYSMHITIAYANLLF